MGGGLPTDALVRAYQRYFRAKDSPNIPSDMLGVVIMDDNSQGPNAPYRGWYAGVSSPQVAAQYSYAWIANEDGPPGAVAPTSVGKSFVVIDEVRVKGLNAADDFVFTVSIKGVIVGGTKISVFAANDELDPLQATSSPRLANVSIQAFQQVGQIFSVNQVWPADFIAGSCAIIRGPFVLGPNGLFAVCPSNVNNGLLAWFRGRYYPPT